MSVNNKKVQSEDLTLEEAKAFECCKDLTDEEIIQLLETIRTFTEIVYSVYAKQNGYQNAA